LCAFLTAHCHYLYCRVLHVTRLALSPLWYLGLPVHTLPRQRTCTFACSVLAPSCWLWFYRGLQGRLMRAAKKSPRIVCLGWSGPASDFNLLSCLRVGRYTSAVSKLPNCDEWASSKSDIHGWKVVQRSISGQFWFCHTLPGVIPVSFSSLNNVPPPKEWNYIMGPGGVYPGVQCRSAMGPEMNPPVGFCSTSPPWMRLPMTHRQAACFDVYTAI
jgi:hypothetical protein